MAFGDGRRPVGQSLKDAQGLAGLPPGRWLGRGLRALGLTEGDQVSERQLELLFGEGRHRTPTASSAASWTMASTRPRPAG
ncbi:relaxase domain-containing protein [Streptomyces anthocyanicus]|uniref:relaxase domain-containing protein n=1 Tax=Streptomyces anthocyanicus TaxID=68174 RepID=UPI0038679857|nr:relaxase domain-containing protein [Streptomyces anthocyanicus]